MTKWPNAWASISRERLDRDSSNQRPFKHIAISRPDMALPYPWKIQYGKRL